MKRIYYIMLALIATLSVAVSCSDDENNEVTSSQLTVQLKAAGGTVDDWTKFAVTVTDMRSGSETSQNADAQGKVVFNLTKGAYSIVAKDSINGVTTMYGRKDNLVLAESTTAEIEVKPVMDTMEKTFVLDELYFNGDNNGDFDNIYYEGYLTIRNVSDRPLFADGLSIAICGDYNSIEESDTDPMPSYLKKDTVVITQLYTIPGDGHTYKVNPGESLVLAHSAINHKLGEDGKVDPNKPHSIDLSGADFEFYVPYEYVQTTDNPEVPNMIVDYSMNQAFNWGYSGSTPIMLVRLDAAKRAEIVKNKVNLDIPAGMGSMKMDHLLLPVSSIVDGIETGVKDNLYHKVLPDAVDRGAILIEGAGLYGGFDGQFVQRKRTTGADGKETVVDTNNSTDDCEVIPHGQKSYPKK